MGSVRKSLVLILPFSVTRFAKYSDLNLRPERESNPRMRVLQTLGLPLAYPALVTHYFSIKNGYL